MAQIAETRAPAPAAYTGYRLVIEPAGRRVRVVFNGETVADSTRALVMHETRLPAAYYFPREDVRMDLLTRTAHRSHCPFKGNASYWTLTVGDRAAENAVWSYEAPFDEAASVGGFVAFYWDRMDAWYVDEEPAPKPERPAESAAGNPFVDFLLRRAWKAKSNKELVGLLAEHLVAAGMPLLRLRLLVQTLNPQLFAVTYTWRRTAAEVEEYQARHAGLESAQFRDSPFAVILKGEGGVRRRLEGPNPRLDYPILKDLLEEGGTDYVAMPMRFSDGQINILTVVADRPGGFSTEQLGHLHEVLPTLSRLVEAHAQRLSSLTLLTTYLGGSAGERVLKGLVKRGDGEELHAVIWFGDLRGSTGLAESLSREAYLATLNEYFDCMAGAVLENGGEVLKFIGDAVLAIFPIDDPDSDRPAAAARAIAAVDDAERRRKTANEARAERGEPPLAFGIGLHRGNLTYGNIGAPGRLDFTVIGSAVNEASRIEGLCKPLGRPVLVSGAFAASIPERCLSLGRHALAGVRDEQEIFALTDGAGGEG